MAFLCWCVFLSPDGRVDITLLCSLFVTLLCISLIASFHLSFVSLHLILQAPAPKPSPSPPLNNTCLECFLFRKVLIHPKQGNIEQSDTQKG